MARHPLSQQCSATAKGTGARCGRWVVAAPVCVVHGGAASQVRAKRESRILAWQAAAGSDTAPRDPGEALMSATHDADRILQQLKSALSAGDLQPSAMLSVVGEWVDRVSRLAKVVIDARIDVRRVELETEKLQVVRLALGRAIVAAQLDAEQRAALLRSFAAELRVEGDALERRSSMRTLPSGPGDDD
jgi:hypothetical protein